MPEEVRQQIEELRDRTQAESMSEVIRRALAVYDYLCDEKDKGNEMIVRSSEGAETRIRLL